MGDYINIGRDDYEPGQAVKAPKVSSLSLVGSSKSLHRIIGNKDSNASIDPDDFDFDYGDDDEEVEQYEEEEDEEETDNSNPASSNPSKANSGTSQNMQNNQPNV